MALSFSANGLAVCNRSQLASLPWRERASKTAKRLRRHRDRALLFGSADASGVTGRSLWGTEDPGTGWTMTERPLRRAPRGGLFRDKNI